MSSRHKNAGWYFLIWGLGFFLLYVLHLGGIKTVLMGRWNPMNAKSELMILSICIAIGITCIPMMMVPEHFRITRRALARAAAMMAGAIAACIYYQAKHWIVVEPQVILVDLEPLVDLFSPLYAGLFLMGLASLGLGLTLVYQIEPSPEDSGGQP